VKEVVSGLIQAKRDAENQVLEAKSRLKVVEEEMNNRANEVAEVGSTRTFPSKRYGIDE